MIKLIKSLLPRLPARIYYNLWVTPFQKQYRENRKDIIEGIVPVRYAKIADVVPGRRILEIGSGEGVLALALARKGVEVVAVDFSRRRVNEAERIKSAWKKKGIDVDNVEFFVGGSREAIKFSSEADTLVAVNVAYHMKDEFEDLLDSLASSISNIVLVGNQNRANCWYLDKGKSDKLGKWNYLATVEGMGSLLESRCFRVVQVEELDSPAVVGTRRCPST